MKTLTRTAARRSAALGAAFVLLVALCFYPARAGASPSDRLSDVLSKIRFLGGNDFAELTKWARNGHPAPSDPVFSLEEAESDIETKLDDADRRAVLSWLRGHGRDELHDRGASDFDIGPPRGDIEAGTGTAPDKWRAIPLAMSSLDGGTQGRIQIIGGFTAIKRDGTAANVCLSFKNLDARVAKHVLIEFPLLDGDGQELGKLVLDRPGEFSPNVDILSYDSMKSWETPSVGPTGALLAGCVRRDLGTAALPFLQARTSGYRVIRVDYADGTSWTARTTAKGQ